MDTDLSQTLAEVDELRRQLKRDLLELRHRLRARRPTIARMRLPLRRGRPPAQAARVDEVLAAVTARHRELELLLDRWGAVRAGDGLGRQRLAAAISAAVHEHVVFEERVVYSLTSGRIAAEAMSAGRERHLEMLAYLPEIAVLSPSGDAFRDAVDLLAATARAHLSSEERDILDPLR